MRPNGTLLRLAVGDLLVLSPGDRALAIVQGRLLHQKSEGGIFDVDEGTMGAIRMGPGWWIVPDRRGRVG